jgi:hypothetical protein
MRIASNDLRGVYGSPALATTQAVRPLAAVDGRAPRDQTLIRPPAERILEGELLRQSPVTRVESILSDARTVLHARARAVTSETPASVSSTLAPFAVLFYQQHSSPEQLAAGSPGRHVNHFV